MKQPVINLQTDEVAVIGYGSLLSVESVGRTLGTNYTRPFYTCQVNGWKRSWNTSMPNRAFYYLENDARIYPQKIIYLNACPERESSINCAIFVLKLQELKLFNEREWIYNAEIVTDFISGVSIVGGNTIMYTSRPEYLVDNVRDPHIAAIRSSYLKILGNALKTIDHSFNMEYERTTDPIPQHLVVNDILDSEKPNPWIQAGYKYAPE